MSKSASHLAVKSLRVASEFVSLVEPRLRHLAALERHLIENQSALRFGDEIVQADFEAAKAADASLSKDRYLREKAPEPIRRRIIAQLGEDGFTLMASQDVTEIFRVYAGLLDCCRFRHFDADGGIRLTEVLARLDDAQHGRLWDLIRAKGLPPSLGIRPPRGGTMTWSGHGQPVFWMNFAFAVLNRGRESLFRISTIPNMIGSQPHQLRAQDLHKPAHGMLEHADCTISLHDMILASKGYAPIYGGVVMRGSDLGPKPAWPGGRLHWEVALQLSHLTQDPSWLSARGQALSRKIADLRASGEIGGMKPKTTQDFSNPHLRLSAEDCCKMLMEEPGAPRVEYQAMEIEHSLGQRVAGLFDRITSWLGVPERAHQFNALNGVFDPANLRAVSPVQHFMVDGFAAFFYRPLRAGVFAPSARRLGQIKPNGQTAMLIPGRPYLAFQDPRKALDLAGDLTAALEQSRLGDRPKPKRQVSVESVAEAAKQEAKKITYAQKQRAAITRMADALTDLAAERKTRDVGLHEFLDAVHHAGADRAQNAFVAMDGAMLRDVITLAQTLPPASTLKPGYRQDQVRRFFEALIEAGSAINLDTGNLRQKL